MSFQQRFGDLKLHLNVFYISIQNEKNSFSKASHTVILIDGQKLNSSFSFKLLFHITSIYLRVILYFKDSNSLYHFKLYAKLV